MDGRQVDAIRASRGSLLEVPAPGAIFVQAEDPPRKQQWSKEMNTQSPTDRNANASSGTPSPVMQLRIHLVDGSVQSFSQADHAKAEQTWLSIEPARLFAQPRLVIAGTHSKSVFVCSEILRIDFVQQCFRCWEFPGGYADVVQLSEAAFRKNAHLDHPELMPKRTHPIPVGDLLVSFLELHFRKNPPICVMVEFPGETAGGGPLVHKVPAVEDGVSHAPGGWRSWGAESGSPVKLHGISGGWPHVPADAWDAEPILKRAGEAT